MTDTSNPDDPLTALEAAARQALIGRPTPPTRTQFLRLCIDQVERCQALGWSAADFASVLSKHMPMTARQFTGALRGARSTGGQWERRRGGKAALAPTKATAPVSTAPAGRPPPPGPGASKAERKAWATAMVPDNGTLLDQLEKKK